MYKNMKIEITDEVHLNAVCDVLESTGYKKAYTTERKVKSVYADSLGCYSIMGVMGSRNITTLAELLSLRDKQFMEKPNAAN